MVSLSRFLLGKFAIAKNGGVQWPGVRHVTSRDGVPEEEEERERGCVECPCSVDTRQFADERTRSASYVFRYPFIKKLSCPWRGRQPNIQRFGAGQHLQPKRVWELPTSGKKQSESTWLESKLLSGMESTHPFRKRLIKYGRERWPETAERKKS